MNQQTKQLSLEPILIPEGMTDVEFLDQEEHEPAENEEEFLAIIKQPIPKDFTWNG